MRVLCKVNTGSSLSVKHFESGYTPLSEFDLKIENEYIVYAINLWKGLLGYLIVGEGLYPRWYPAELFSITRSELSAYWHFAHFNSTDGFEINAIWGYEEIVESAEHFDALSNLEKNAVEIFLTRKYQTDEVS